jgi:thiamine biosynthesis lipoprotein
MNRLTFLGGCALLVLGAANAFSEDQRFVFEKAEMGVPMRLTLYAADSETARKAADAAFERVEVLNGILSDYDSDSELSRLSRSSGQGKPVPISEVLWTVLDQSQEIAAKTDGAFDVTIGPLVNLWRRMRRKQELPSPELIAEMRGRVGYQNLRLDPKARTAELLKPDMRLDVGGIAKGYASDEAIATLAKHGITRALAALSGDIVAGDPPPGEPGWRVEVESLDVPRAPPAQVFYLANQGVSTSGDAYQFVDINGTRYSHIINPNTGIGMTGRSMVTVVAPRGIIADGWDTPIDIIGPERGISLIEAIPGAAMRMVRERDGKAEVFESSRWRQFEDTGPKPSRSSDTGQTPTR